MDQLKQWIGQSVCVVRTYYGPVVGILRASDDRWLTLENDQGIAVLCLYSVAGVSLQKS